MSALKDFDIVTNILIDMSLSEPLYKKTTESLHRLYKSAVAFEETFEVASLWCPEHLKADEEIK